ncbi:MAG: hypothetical protein BJ554DRAFT_5275 [Olpidium bornovanus]|uniref:Uncharacterized protein n=1 Tax=Olpidium bornovanus TaxID=278681 RepID=A0A8H7ZZZ1_9FUNG|nr:MAG: hypothetical protein BJ554DRAFT_5275 [Olpidium bornovanus]
MPWREEKTRRAFGRHIWIALAGRFADERAHVRGVWTLVSSLTVLRPSPFPPSPLQPGRDAAYLMRNLEAPNEVSLQTALAALCMYFVTPKSMNESEIGASTGMSGHILGLTRPAAAESWAMHAPPRFVHAGAEESLAAVGRLARVSYLGVREERDEMRDGEMTGWLTDGRSDGAGGRQLAAGGRNSAGNASERQLADHGLTATEPKTGAVSPLSDAWPSLGRSGYAQNSQLSPGFAHVADGILAGGAGRDGAGRGGRRWRRGPHPAREPAAAPETQAIIL